MSSLLYSTVFHKKNSTPGVIPALSALSASEIAINTHDGILFTKTVNDVLKIFLNKDLMPYTLDTSLSAITSQYGQNVVSQVLSNILGGYLNSVSGAGSSIINGELNSLSGDFGFIGGGAQNIIASTGDFSAILGGHHNLIRHTNSFTLGSNLTSHADNFTYVNNISGVFHGDGSKLTGITSTTIDNTKLPLSGGTITGDLTVSGLLSAASSNNWNSVYTTVNSNSSSYVTLTATQTLTNKTVVDWMTLVRGYNTTPTLTATIPTGEVYSYVYNSSPSNITYYRYIATDGSEDAFYSSLAGNTVSGLVARKSIIL